MWTWATLSGALQPCQPPHTDQCLTEWPRGNQWQLRDECDVVGKAFGDRLQWLSNCKYCRNGMVLLRPRKQFVLRRTFCHVLQRDSLSHLVLREVFVNDYPDRKAAYKLAAYA